MNGALYAVKQTLLSALALVCAFGPPVLFFEFGGDAWFTGRSAELGIPLVVIVLMCLGAYVPFRLMGLFDPERSGQLGRASWLFLVIYAAFALLILCLVRDAEAAWWLAITTAVVSSLAAFYITRPGAKMKNYFGAH